MYYSIFLIIPAIPLLLYRKYLYYFLKGLCIYFSGLLLEKLEEKAPIILERKDGHIQITYTAGGIKHIFVPISYDMSLEASQCAVISHFEDGTTKELFHEHDVPILITANNIGAKYIIVKNNYTDEERTFTGDQPIEFFM